MYPPSSAATPERRSGVNFWVACAVCVALCLTVVIAAVFAASSFQRLEAARSAAQKAEAEATEIVQRYSALSDSHAEQFAVFESDEQALLAEGYALTGTTGVYSRAGTVELPGDGAHCVQYENCMLFVLRSNSFTECPAGATVELQASTGQRISGTNQTPLPRNGTLPFEIEWPLGNATAELSAVTCE